MSADTSTFSAIIDTNLQHGEISTWRESSEGEHADLLRDVLPAARGSQLFEAFLQSIPHGNDSGNGNTFRVGKALAAQLRGQILLIPASEDISTHLTSRPSS